ncbi:hypothetical protein ALC62_13932 [Cyphomyrmex costatus]|uniref:Uncharacterized protein n=1 Tax=Cyphomyrmex costatus TaxID=456900 RepID=A0A195C3S0_9HYME|nr:hypothetical protein ALC62_13932 [Cyphomyrmex costatus]
MICYFGWIIIDLRGIFNAIFIDNYTKSKIKTIISHSYGVSHHIFKFMLINYMCETVSTKASATADLLNKLSYVTGDDEIREIVSLKMSSLNY